MKTVKVIAVGIITYALLFLLTGCYSSQKARKQFGRATVTYPEIPAEYCARTYPPKDTIIQGKDIVKTDTLWGEGETVFIRDTIRNRDTVFIKTVERLPGQVITRTVFRTDTVYQENRAALDLANINLTRSLALSDEKTKLADKWRKIAKKRFWIILGMGAVMALGIFAMIKKKVAKKIPL